MSKFVFENGGWWEIEGNLCYNVCGGCHEYIPDEKDIIIEAENRADLDYSLLIDPNSKYGWISPEGKFYGCDYAKHRDLAEWYFKKNERQLESEGWIKVFRDSFDRKTVWYSEKSFITEAQKNTLEQRSLEIDEYWEIV